MRESAVEVAGHLLDFGVTAADSVEELVRLLITLGFQQAAFRIQDRLGSADNRARLSELAADQLVIHPPSAGSSSPETARDADLVRQSLERLQANDEAGSLSLLRDLPRSSSLSEWKFFIRGLAAFYRGEAEESQANWDRLDPGRAASAIAKRLPRPNSDPPAGTPPNLRTLEVATFGEPVLDRLMQIRSFTAEHEWDKVIRLVSSLRPVLNRIDPVLAERLTVVVIGSLVKAASEMHWAHAERVVTQFTRAAQPLAIDPRWNRLWAILWDGPHAEPDGAIEYWEEYIDDLATVEALKPAERSLAQAIVWNHVAELHRTEVESWSDTDQAGFAMFGLPVGPLADQNDVAASKKGVIDALERSLRLAPDYLKTHRLLVKTYDEWDDAPKLEAAARRLLASFPEDLDTLKLLAGHYIERNDLSAALPLAQKARQLKPLDDSLRDLEWFIRVGLARQCALSERWDEGRAEFAAAEQLQPDSPKEFYFLARRVVFELKAGDTAESARYLAGARALLTEPAPLWLALLIEAIRYQMPPATVDAYAQLWQAELKKKYRSETGAELAGLLGGFLSARVDYEGRGGHIDQVIAYLRRGARAKHRCEDFERIVEFLCQLPDETALVKNVVKSAVKKYPDSAMLNFRAALAELNEETFFGGSKSARRHLEIALRLAEASTDPKVTALLDNIRGVLGMFNEFSERSGIFSALFGGGPFSSPRRSRGKAEGKAKSRAKAPPGPSIPFLQGLDFGDDLDDLDLDDEDGLDGGDFILPDFFPGPVPPMRRSNKRTSRKRR
jgi:hypothetical protein